MVDSPTTARITENGDSPYAVTINVSGCILKGDEPKEKGGGSLGPSPYDMLLAALGECTSMTIRWYAIQQHWPLEKVEVTLTHRKEGRTDHFEKHLTITGPELTDEQRNKLYEVAAKCPVQRTLEGTPVITTTHG